MRRVSLVWRRLRFPREVPTSQGLAALLAINGHSTPKRREAIVLEVFAVDGEIGYRLGAPESRMSALQQQLQTIIPGLAVETTTEPELRVSRSWQAWQTSATRSLDTSRPEFIAAALLTAMADAKGSESVVLQWLLGPVRRPTAVSTQVTGSHGPTVLAALAKAPFIAPADLDSEARQALRTKQSLPGWRASLYIGVTASTVARQRQLLGDLSAAARLAQGPSIELGFDGLRPSTMAARRWPWWPRLTIQVGELLGLSALPIGDPDLTAHLPIARVRSRLLPPPRTLSSHGYVLGESSYPGRERPVALPLADSLKHLHLIGATGSGKSTVALHLIVQAIDANRSVVVIEPKDLVAEVLARIPESRWDDVVVIGAGSSDRVTGFNPLVQPGVPGELIVDQVLSVFKGLFGEAIGPRTQDILTAGLLTLVAQPLRSPARTLVALPLLFTDARFRAELLSHIYDPLGVMPFWAWWDNLSPAEQAAVLAAPMNKLRSLVVRAPLRRTIGQATPEFDLRQVFTRRRIVLFALSPGALGPESAHLLGSLALSMIWQATLGRVSVPAEQRHPVLLVADEFQNFTHLSEDFADVLVQARSLGLGVVLSHQNLAQLSNRTLRSAVLSNARSRLVFATGHDDAVEFVKTDRRLKPEDVTGLGSYQAYASILTDNEAQPYASLQTLPPPPPVSDPDAVRAYAAERWGQPAEQIDRDLEALVGIVPGATDVADDDPTGGFGVRRRRPRQREERP